MLLAGQSRGKPGIARAPRAAAWWQRLGLLLSAAALAWGCQGVIEDQAAPFSGSGHSASPSTAAARAATVDDQAEVAQLTNDAALQAAALRYFPTSAAASGKARLFRLTRTQLDLTTQTLLPQAFKTTSSSVLPRDPLQTNYEYADNLSWNQANFTPYVRWVEALAAAVRAAPSSLVNCASMADEACLRTQAERFVRTAFRGLATSEQLERFTSFFVSDVKDAGLAEAAADLVALTLSSPSFVFRDEVPREAAQLSAAQRLQNISYALADASPEALGLSSLDAGKYVGTEQAQAATIDKVLASELARKKLVRFFVAWLEVREPAEFGIDPSVFPEFTQQLASAAVADTQAFLQQKLAGDAPSLHAITQSHDAVVSDALAAIYGVPKGDPTKLRALDPLQRLGIFTQPAVIASHSGPTTTRLIKRGVFFTRKVMCLPLGLPPAGVNTTLPEVQSKTERERVAQATQSATCQGCHSVINPFGFMQENYDAIGRYRTLDNGQPIDAHVELAVLDAVSGKSALQTSNAIDALSAITDSYLFAQCFTRQMFRFYLGREDAPEDNAVLRRMFVGFADKGQQDIVQMLRGLALSAAFSERTEAL